MRHTALPWIAAVGLLACARSDQAPVTPDNRIDNRTDVDGVGGGATTAGQGGTGSTEASGDQETVGTGSASEPRVLETPMERPSVPPEATTAEVWVGKASGISSGDCWRQQPSNMPQTNSLGDVPIVLILDTASDGTPILASLLFGEGDPPPPPSDEPLPLLASFLPGCDEAPALGFEYPVRQLESEGSRLRLAFAPMDAYRPWCRDQEPIPLSGAEGEMNAPTHACRNLEDRQSRAGNLCLSFEGSTRCECDQDGCDLVAPTVFIDMVRMGDRMDGYMQSSFADVISSVPRVQLRRVE